MFDEEKTVWLDSNGKLGCKKGFVKRFGIFEDHKIKNILNILQVGLN